MEGQWNGDLLIQVTA